MARDSLLQRRVVSRWVGERSAARRGTLSSPSLAAQFPIFTVQRTTDHTGSRHLCKRRAREQPPARPTTSLSTLSWRLYLCVGRGAERKGGTADEAPLPPRVARRDVPYYFGERLYKQLYRQIYASPSYRKIYSKIPTLHIYDDHEVLNNWASNTTAPFPAAFDAYQVYNGEGNPIKSWEESWYDFKMGQAAAFFVMDTRRYRDVEEKQDGPDKSMLGEMQLADLLDWAAKVNQTRWARRGVGPALADSAVSSNSSYLPFPTLIFGEAVSPCPFDIAPYSSITHLPSRRTQRYMGRIYIRTSDHQQRLSVRTQCHRPQRRPTRIRCNGPWHPTTMVRRRRG